jgi:hypothetical protein
MKDYATGMEKSMIAGPPRGSIEYVYEQEGFDSDIMNSA